MKKSLLTLGIFIATSLGITFWASIGDISLRFCNGTGDVQKNLSLNISGQQAQDICIQLTNSASDDTYVNLSFVDGTVTNDSDQKKACKNEGENQNFGKYVTRDGKPVLVPAGKTITTNAKLQFAEEVAGEIHGCVTYFVANPKSNGEMFTIMVRRASFIDALVKGTVTVGLGLIDLSQQENNISNNPKIISYFDTKEGKLYIQATLKNKGTAEQKATIKGTISNRFGYNKTFIEEERNIIAKETSNLNTVIDNLPFYKGPFTIKYTITHKAVIGNGLKTDDNNADETIVESANITIRSTASYVMIAIFGLLIIGCAIVLLKKKGTKKPTTSHQTQHHKHK